jgi:hypothetical protein
MLSYVLFPDIDFDRRADVTKLTRFKPWVKTLIFSHATYRLRKIPDNLEKSKIILLVRDPRDIVVSSYFEHTKRTGGFNPDRTISEFIRDDTYGIQSIVDFYNEFYEKYESNIKYVIAYEELHADTISALKNIIPIITKDKRYLEETKLNKALLECEFNKLQNRSKDSKDLRLRPYDVNDNESNKFRKGKVGDFINYFSEDDIKYLNSILGKMNPTFGYQSDNA